MSLIIIGTVSMNKPKIDLNTQLNGMVLMPQLLTIKDVMAITSLSRASIYDLMDEFSGRFDESFPKQVKLSKNRVVWLASELLAWINNKIEERGSDEESA